MGRCSKCIKRIIKQCDIFGILITFKIKNEDQYQSIHGGIASLIFIMFTLFYVLYQGIPFITRKNLEFIFSNKILDTQPYINLIDAHFYFGFGLRYQENSSPAIQDSEKYFNYSIILTEWNEGGDNIQNLQLGLKKCTKSDFLNNVNSTFEQNKINEMYCPILNDTFNYNIQGLFTDDYIKYIQLDIRLTEYGMNNFEEVRAFMQSTPIEMTIYFLDTGIDYRNKSNPLPLYINYVNRGLDLIFSKTTEIFLSTIEFSNDENFIINNPKKRIDGMLDRSEDSFHYIVSRINSQNNLVGKFIIKASPKVVVLERKYQKFPSFIAETSSMIENAYVILSFVLCIVEKEVVQNKLIHKMLKMKGSKNYDIKYFFTVFERKNINNNLMKMINQKNLLLKKTTTGVVDSNDKNTNILIKDNKNENDIENNKEKNSCDEKILKGKRIFNIKSNNFIYSSKREELNLGYQGKIINTNHKVSQSISVSSIPSQEIEEWNNTDNNNKNVSNEIYETKNNIMSPETNFYKIKTKSMMDVIEAEKDFPLFTIYSNFFSYFCFHCSKYQKRKYELIINAKKKINYYREIFNYIKAMHEIDLFKYCLLDKEQFIIFDYLSRPTYKVDGKKNDDLIYHEFEKEQNAFSKIGKKEIDKICDAYNVIRNKEELTFEDLKLLRLLNAEIDYLS